MAHPRALKVAPSLKTERHARTRDTDTDEDGTRCGTDSGCGMQRCCEEKNPFRTNYSSIFSYPNKKTRWRNSKRDRLRSSGWERYGSHAREVLPGGLLEDPLRTLILRQDARATCTCHGQGVALDTIKCAPTWEHCQCQLRAL